jgi:hypothetical protein
MVLLNWPIVLCRIPVPEIKLMCFIPALFWINIPALWFGLAKLIGKPHYDIQEFGAMPLTPFAWVLIAAFWILLAFGCAAVTVQFSGMFYRKRQEKRESSGKSFKRGS